MAVDAVSSPSSHRARRRLPCASAPFRLELIRASFGILPVSSVDAEPVNVLEYKPFKHEKFYPQNTKSKKGFSGGERRSLSKRTNFRDADMSMSLSCSHVLWFLKTAMSRYRGVATVATLFMAATAFTAEPTLSVAVDASSIYVGDAFTLSVTLDGAPAGSVAPQLANTAKAQIRGGEPRSQSSRSITIINGQRTDNSIERTSWVYAVTPEETGVFSMGTASAKVNGKTLSARIPDVRVVGAEPQPYAAVEISSSRESVLLDESFEVFVSVVVAKLDGSAADTNPMPGGSQTPGLIEIPFLSDGVVKGATFERKLEDLLNPLMQRREDAVGFRINDFAVNSGVSMFSMFQERQPAVFYFDRAESELNGKPAWKYSLVFPMKATDEGVCRFPAARFKGVVFAKQEGTADVKQLPVFAVSQPLEVKVTPPPEAGRPASFIGSLGTHITASVVVDAQSCRQGDPLQLTLDIAGDLTTSNMREPKIFENKAMAERFRQYGDIGHEKTASGMRYTYKIRPMVSGTIEIPSFELSFYNTITRTYETVNTAPVPLRVDPAPELDLNAILGVSTNAESARLALRQQLVPSAITVSSKGISEPEALNRRKVLAVALIPPVVYGLLVVVAGVWRRRKAFGTAVRRSSATSRSVRGILKAKTPQQVMDAVGLLLRDKMGAKGGGFTPGDVRNILAGQGVDAVTCEEISNLLQEVFDSGFSPDSDPTALVKARRTRIAELFSGIKLSLILLFVAGFVATSSGAQEKAASFVWRQANATASSARTQEDFRQAALVYRELIDGGTVNGALLYNYGTMLLFAGLSSEAVDAFERAEALDGASPELENNLDLALGAVDKAAHLLGEGGWQGVDSATALPWYRVPLFWHYGVPVSVRLEALAVMWGILWLGMMLKFARLRRIGKVLVAVGLVGLAVFGSSVLASKRVLDKPMPEVPALHETAERTVAP